MARRRGPLSRVLLGIPLLVVARLLFGDVGLPVLVLVVASFLVVLHLTSKPGARVRVEGHDPHRAATLLGMDPPDVPLGHTGPLEWIVPEEGEEPVALVPAPATGTRPDGSVVAPDQLVGGAATLRGAIVEGWYATADGTRERWHNGSSWTAHERARGSVQP